MCNKMSSPTMLCKNNESGMRECDKFWKEKSEIQSTWEKKHILKYKPADSIYTSIMKFRYIEDYKKMKKLNEILYKIVKKIDKSNQPIGYYKNQIDFVYELEEETRNLLNIVQNCNFFNVDYYDGIVFVNKFSSIFDFLTNGNKIDHSFRKLISEMGWGPDGMSMYLHDILEKEIIPKLKKIYNELLKRVFKSLE